jgi:threonine 3-dehydrogenase
MTRKAVTLVTGAAGELGDALVPMLADAGEAGVLGLDVQPLAPAIARRCAAVRTGNVVDPRVLDDHAIEFEIAAIFHLAAILSARAESAPELAHAVNVQGTLNVLRMASEASRRRGHPVPVLFPSSIAVYGLPDLASKRTAGRVAEHEWTEPRTLYGCTKLHAEHLGRYFAHHRGRLGDPEQPVLVDFRAIRFPGLVSATTLPTGGTSDYGPEMIHAAAQGRPYTCFVRDDTRIPFMAMPDAVSALLALLHAPAEALTTTAYNVRGFSASAAELAARVRAAYPGARITFTPDARRQAIADSWPEDVDDARARRDWGFAPAYDADRTFDGYLVPSVRRRYAA